MSIEENVASTAAPAFIAPSHPARLGWWFVLMAATLWGTTGIAFSALAADGQTNALSISFLRLAMSVPFLLIGARVLLGPGRTALDARGWFVLACLGAGMALYQVTYVLAIERVGVAISVLISICGAPVIVALISVLFLGERFSVKTLVALAVTVVGTVLLVGFPDAAAATTARFWEGVAIAFACAFFQALYVLAARAAGEVCHPMRSVGIGFALGALMLLPFAVAQGLVLRYSPEGWLMLLYIAALPTALAQTLFLMGLKTTGAVGGAIASLLEPLVSSVLAVVLLGERMGPVATLGAVVLLSGIVIVQWQSPPPRAEPRGATGA